MKRNTLGLRSLFFLFLHLPFSYKSCFALEKKCNPRIFSWAVTNSPSPPHIFYTSVLKDVLGIEMLEEGVFMSSLASDISAEKKKLLHA